MNVQSPAAGEFGDSNQVLFTIFRSGPPAGNLNVPIEFSGSATAADFSVPFPASAAFTDGQSAVQCSLPIVADDLYEGNESIAISAQSTMSWLVPQTPYPVATVADRPFQGWMANKLPGSTDGPEADSDGDSWANVLEFFTGSLPGDPTSGVQSGLAAGQNSTLRYQRDPAATDVDAKVLWSTNLIDWKESGESQGALTVNITESVVETSPAGIQTVDAAAQASGGNPAKLFLRLKVQLH